MRSLVVLFSIATILFGFSGCASKRYASKAEKFDNAGLYTDAADMYYRSLAANKNNIEAKVGLQRTGQMVLEDKIKTFSNLYSSGTPKEAVYAFREAEAYYKKLSALGVLLELSEDQRAYYREVEDLYLNKVYQDASKALELEEFLSAEPLFREITSINKSYKDSHSKWIIAKYEPVYRRGQDHLNNQLYRKAYYDYETILKGAGTYKNSLELKKEALEKATITIAIAPFSYRGSHQQNVATKLKTKLVNQINKLESPFYKVINDPVVQSAPASNFQGDAATYIQWLKSLGANVQAKTILTGKVVRVYSKPGSLRKVEKRAYRKYTVEVVNETTKLKEKQTKYDKVKYFEYEQKNTVQLSIQYSLVRIDNGEIVLSDVFTAEETDKVHYAKYTGNFKQLVPGQWKSATQDAETDKIFDDQNAIRQLHQLFSNKKELRSAYQIEADLINKGASIISNHIANYNPEN